jgi:hypothetical protein
LLFISSLLQLYDITFCVIDSFQYINTCRICVLHSKCHGHKQFKVLT